MTTDLSDFREVKHLLIIFSLYRFEFHTKTLIFTVFEKSNFMLTKQHLRFWFSALIGRKVRLKPIKCLSKFMVLQLINHVGNGFDVSRMEISALKTSSGQPKKFEDKELRHYSKKIRDKRKRRMQERLQNLALGITSRFCTIDWEWFKNKEIECLWTEIERCWKAIQR